MKSMDVSSVGRERGSNAPRTLYCFPYSGTGGVIYQSWVKALAPDIDVCPVELPGRWGRLREAPYESLDDLVEALGPVLAEDARAPYALFGCSFGGLVAFELCRFMRRIGRSLPSHLFIAATRGPGVKRASPTMHMLSDSALIRRVGDLYGPLPTAILESPDMRDMVLRILRADLKCVETYRYRPEAPLPVPITVFGGKSDPGIGVELLEDWREQSDREVDVRVLDAGHLFLASHERELLSVIRDAMLALSPARPHMGSPEASIG